MTTIATIGLPVAESWQISVGGGWIVVLLIAMGLCFVGMLAFSWLMRDARGWAMCGWRAAGDGTHVPRAPLPEGPDPRDNDQQRTDVRVRTAVPRSDLTVSSLESEAQR
jgi:hypothetical protein